MYKRQQQPHFANARSVRNALDRIKLRQANRLMRVGGVVDREELMRIDAADSRQSRVFRGGADGDMDQPPAEATMASVQPIGIERG